VNLTLDTCTQPDLDQWAAGDDVRCRDETGHFIRCAAARRLLHDDTITTPDRVAGLLLLLYAQRLAAISTLTVEHVTTANGQVALRLGSAATILPEPVAALVLNLVATCRPYTVVGNPIELRGCFPANAPDTTSAPTGLANG
jgi:hypothetical protein